VQAWSDDRGAWCRFGTAPHCHTATRAARAARAACPLALVRLCPIAWPLLPAVGECRHNAVRAVLVAFVMTFFSLFNIPVFWPILLIYFLALLGMTLKNQIAHMVKYRYVPINWGKTKYRGKDDKKKEGGEPRFMGPK
jgi:hypothetical protein